MSHLGPRFGVWEIGSLALQFEDLDSAGLGTVSNSIKWREMKKRWVRNESKKDLS